MLSEQQWADVQTWLENEVGQERYASWLKPLSPLSGESTEGALTLVVPTHFMRDWVLRHFDTTLKEGIATIADKPLEISYVVKADLKQPAARPAPAEHAASIVANPAPPATQTPVETAPAQTPSPAPSTPQLVEGQYQGNILDPRFTFDNFVTGKSNEFAYAAAKKIAETEDLSYNPFFLYGGVGLGKTHLMHAIAWQLQQTTPHRKVLYISAEKFLHNFISAIKNKDVTAFQQTFRSVDVLMIDDVQFIAGKDATQEEFFHTFNALIDARKQIILTADKSPHELSSIEARLKSRLGWGLATEIHKPSMETRMAILAQKSQQLGVALERDVTMFLADRIDSNIRELEGALNRLVAHATLVDKPITIDSTQELLKDLFRANDRTTTLADIQKKVAEYFSIKVSDMHSARRSRNVARPRQIAMYLSKDLTTKSYPEIGKSFGGRDHTTVMHACKTIDKMCAEDASLAEDVHLLKNLISGAQ